MTQDEILAFMRQREPRRIFYTMQLGGRVKQLQGMEDAGLISSQARYGGGHRQRNWFLTEAQHAVVPSNEWLRQRIETDPDMETEARSGNLAKAPAE